MSEVKNYKLIKTVPGNVLIVIHPVSNPMLSKEIYLTKRLPQVSLPEDWALGIFLDDALYSMYKQGIFTFADNDSIVKAAQEAGVFFDEIDTKELASPEQTKTILSYLKNGNRTAIKECINKYGKDLVLNVTMENLDDLTNNVISFLESEEGLGTQLRLYED